MVTPKATAKLELLIASEIGLLKISVRLLRLKQIITEFIALIVVNLVTPKAVAKLERFLNKPTTNALVSFNTVY